MKEDRALARNEVLLNGTVQQEGCKTRLPFHSSQLKRHATFFATRGSISNAVLEEVVNNIIDQRS